MTTSDPPPSISDEEGREFVDAVSYGLGRVTRSGLSRNDVELADGYRKIMGLVAFCAWEAQLDPTKPLFRYYADGVTRGGLSNPDNLHRVARIDGSCQYQVTGFRGTTTDLIFQTFRTAPGRGRDVGTLSVEALRVQADGGYLLSVGPEQEGENWVGTDAETTWLLVRDSHDNWDKERPGLLTIDLVGGTPPDRGPGSSPERGVRQSAALLRGQVDFWVEKAIERLSTLEPNVIPTPRRGGGVLPDQWTTMALFDIGPDECLLIEMVPSTARYQGIQLGSVWFDPLGDGVRQTSLTRSQSHVGPDGVCRYLVCGQDPLVPNWLDTVGHDRGFMVFRWQGVDRTLDPGQFPTCRILPVSGLRERLPHAEPFVGTDERRAALQNRGKQLQARFGEMLRAG